MVDREFIAVGWECHRGGSEAASGWIGSRIVVDREPIAVDQGALRRIGSRIVVGWGPIAAGWEPHCGGLGAEPVESGSAR